MAGTTATINEADVSTNRDTIQKIEDTITRVFVGKDRVIRLLLTGFVSSLHVLIEDVPGVGKTTLARSLAASLGMDFSRIQFTPDLLPGDIVGMNVWNQSRNEFVFKQGAIMHQFVLADEINRASPRTQSSLLEAMQEESVTIDGTTYPLPKPFFVIATQNPSSFTGSFHLPEGEIDRFGVSFSIGYPSDEDEMEILSRFQDDNPFAEIGPVVTPQEVGQIRAAVRRVFIDPKVKEFLIEIVKKTRNNKFLHLGASPRASQHLQRAAQGNAMMNGRTFVVPEDVVELAAPVLAHRVLLSAESKMANKAPHSIIEEIVRDCRMPVGIS